MADEIKGVNLKQGDIDTLFLSSPGEDLVLKTMMQMAAVPGFLKLFGPWKAPAGTIADNNQRWADYNRHDWSMRQLPAINVYESGVQNKTSDQGFLMGQITIMVMWPANFRRSDSRRIEVAFQGVMTEFFNSKLVADMLDEIYYVQRPAKVYGLNELGKTLNWTPNVEGLVEDKLVPVTILDIPYRIDLRAWNRALEFMGRTKDQPFDKTLDDLVGIGIDGSGYQGVDDTGAVKYTLPDEIEVENP
jgi:hypothetical protein